jgi:hypothetical protein
MGYLAGYLPLCLAPLIIYMIWRLADRSLPVPVFLIGGYAWAALLLGAFGVAAAARWGGCGADPEPDIVKCTAGATQCQRPFNPACPDRFPGTCQRLEPGSLYCPPGATATFQYCERPVRGAIAQEQSTWSDLAFMGSGLFVAMMLDLDRRRPAWRTRRRSFMVGPSLFSISYVILVIFMGPASMFLHAGMKAWGGFFDNFSIMLWIWMGTGYSVSRWGIYAPKQRNVTQQVAATAMAILIFAVGAALSAALSLRWPSTRAWNVPLFGSLWAANEIAQCIFLAVFRRFRKDTEGFVSFVLLGLIAALLGVGLGLKEWCESPTSALQGHPLFHTFAAAATFLAFILWRLKPDAPDAIG